MRPLCLSSFADDSIPFQRGFFPKVPDNLCTSLDGADYERVTNPKLMGWYHRIACTRNEVASPEQQKRSSLDRDEFARGMGLIDAELRRRQR